ncbi:hypothetical protein [Rhodopseudomonas sp.]|uniref:hypothetical protein n=1 Tax=Rhodopseudomonas sp. TaxID=1078 RepID=UPI0039C9F86A
MAAAAVGFTEVFAVVFGIALLLFLGDLAAAVLELDDLEALAEALFESLAATRAEVRERVFVALRLAAAAFFTPLETLFLRVFCDTACAWTATPLFDVAQDS